MNRMVFDKSLRVRMGRVGLAGALAATMGIGALEPIAAFADTKAEQVVYADGTFTIESVANADAVYDVYPVFFADMNARGYAEDDFDTTEYPVIDWPGIATKISWNDDAKDATLAFLDLNGYGAWIEATFSCTASDAKYTFEHGLPQNAAHYIAREIGASENDDGAATVPAAKAERTFALNLARALAASGMPVQATTLNAQGNAGFTGTEGYYLFVTRDDSVGADEAATSPIWVPLGGSTSSIQEKAAIPTLDKQVKEDSTQIFGYVADGSKGQDLDYKLTATMPANIKAFNNYWLGFTDTLPEGLELAGGDTSSVKVVLNYNHGGNAYSPDITLNSNVRIAYAGNVLKVSVVDLKKVYANIDKDATVEVFYKAHITDAAAMGAAGNQNSAVLKYSSNPITYYDPYDPENPLATPDPADPGYDPKTDPNSPEFDPEEALPGTGETLEGAHKTRTCTWRIELNKVDKQTHANLAGAKFTARVAETVGSLDTDSVGKYVQADGSLADEPCEFVTDADGMFTIPRIDSGTYVLHETAAPEGYEFEDADITVSIAPVFDQIIGEVDDQVPEWSATVTGGEAIVQSPDDVITHLVDKGDATAMATALSEGRISIQTSDDKKIVMPITGLDGTAIAVALAGGGLIASIAGLYASRRRRDTEAKRV